MCNNYGRFKIFSLNSRLHSSFLRMNSCILFRLIKFSLLTLNEPKKNYKQICDRKVFRKINETLERKQKEENCWQRLMSTLGTYDGIASGFESFYRRKKICWFCDCRQWSWGTAISQNASTLFRECTRTTPGVRHCLGHIYQRKLFLQNVRQKSGLEWWKGDRCVKDLVREVDCMASVKGLAQFSFCGLCFDLSQASVSVLLAFRWLQFTSNSL